MYKLKHLRYVIAFAIIASIAMTTAVGFGGAAAIGNEVKKLFTTTGPNGETIQVEGRKDVVALNTEASPVYSAEQREWKGEPAQWAEIENTIRDALHAEQQAMLDDNRGRSDEFKKKFADYYSSKSGELEKRKNYVDVNGEMTDSSGLAIKDIGISKIDFKGISIDTDTATVVADVWSWCKYKNTKNKGPFADPEAKNARQHTFTLRLENGKWLITDDRWVFIPGYEP